MRPRRQIVQNDLSGNIEEQSRPTRSTRQTPSSSRNNGISHQESDDDSDDDQLLSQIASQNRTKRSPRAAASAPLTTEFVDTTSPEIQNGLPRTREMIRRKQSTVSTTSTTIVTSNQNHHSTRSMTVETSQIEITRNQVSLRFKLTSLNTSWYQNFEN